MNIKYKAVFFICILSSDYVNGVAGVLQRSNYNERLPCCRNRRRVARETTCRIKPEGVKVLDDCLDRVRRRIPDSFTMEDQILENEYEMTDVVGRGFKNFEKKPYRCSCGKNLVRILIRVDFVRILVTFVISLLDTLLGGLLGTLGSTLAQVLGNVVNLLVRVLALRIYIQLVILQRFISGATCIVERYHVSKLLSITILNLDLSAVAEILSPILTPVLDLLLQIIFTGKVREIFRQEFEKIIILKRMVSC